MSGRPWGSVTGLNKILAKHTGQSVEKIKQDTDRDNFLSCQTTPWNTA